MFTVNAFSNRSRFTSLNYKQTSLKVLVASISLGLAGCNISNGPSNPGSSSGTGSADFDTGALGPGFRESDKLSESDLPNTEDGEKFSDDIKDIETVVNVGESDSDSETVVSGIKAGLYTFNLQNLKFTGFQENEFGYVAFDLASIRVSGSDVSGWRLQSDQLVMNDIRSNNTELPLHKVYVEEQSDIDHFFFRSQLIPLGVSEPEKVDARYSLGMERTEINPVDTPWDGAWDMAVDITHNTCNEDATGVRPAQTAEVRVIGDDFFIGPNSGPFTWLRHFSVDGDSITVDSEARRWLRVADEKGVVSKQNVMESLSQTDGMTGKVDGDTFFVKYQQEFRLPVGDIEVFCTIDLRIDGERVSDD